MTPAEQLLQRYQDGEANRAQQAAVQGLLAEDPDLAARFHRLEQVDGLLRRQGARVQADAGGLVVRVMERLPAETPRVQAAVSMAHVVMALLTIAMVVAASVLAGLCRPWLPTEGIAAACALVGLALVVAARPLAGLENSLLSGFLAKRVAVGDGEVLVCRALGIALLIGAAHIAGLWS